MQYNDTIIVINNMYFTFDLSDVQYDFVCRAIGIVNLTARTTLSARITTDKLTIESTDLLDFHATNIHFITLFSKTKCTLTIIEYLIILTMNLDIPMY